VTRYRALGEFLRSRRARLRPVDVGLPPGPGRRQTPGLRREEVATLAGVSIDYYIRLEQGRDTNPGRAVLDALAAALRMTDDERTHLRLLARNAEGAPDPARPGPAAPRPGLLRLLDSVRPTPGFVLSQASDLLAANPEGLALLTGIDDWPPQRRNLVRYVFRHPDARALFDPWRAMAQDCVAHLRTVEGRDPAEPGLPELVAELRADSTDFDRLWRHYDVRIKSGSRRVFAHPTVGRMELTSEILTAPDGQRFVVFAPEPASPAQDAVTLLSLTVRGGV
jgi:transcriptional regulator with XRE-family HTH domain